MNQLKCNVLEYSMKVFNKFLEHMNNFLISNFTILHNIHTLTFIHTEKVDGKSTKARVIKNH